MVNGLPFALTGLAPSEPSVIPPAKHLFGLSSDILRQPLEAATLVPGPGLTDGSNLLPVLRSQAWLTARLAALPGVVGVAWQGARSWSAPEFFRSTVMRWIAGGVFPSLGLAAVGPTDDGGFASEGLALFTGQELELAGVLATDRVQGARIAIRLMHWLVENGAVHQPEDLVGPSGEHLRLVPSRDRRVIKVQRI